MYNDIPFCGLNNLTGLEKYSAPALAAVLANAPENPLLPEIVLATCRVFDSSSFAFIGVRTESWPVDIQESQMVVSR